MAERSGIPVPPTRRTVFAAAGGAGLAAVLTACGSDSGSDSSSGTPSGATTTAGTTGTPSAPATSFGADSTAPSASAGAGGTPLGKTSEIPVGGGKIFADQKVVVTQPTAGEFKGFSATCTHQGCLVTGVSDGTINCPCHGSQFHVADGSVANGPATAPLPAKRITVSGDSVSLA